MQDSWFKDRVYADAAKFEPQLAVDSGAHGVEQAEVKRMEHYQWFERALLIVLIVIQTVCFFPIYPRGYFNWLNATGRKVHPGYSLEFSIFNFCYLYNDLPHAEPVMWMAGTNLIEVLPSNPDFSTAHKLANPILGPIRTLYRCVNYHSLSDATFGAFFGLRRFLCLAQALALSTWLCTASMLVRASHRLWSFSRQAPWQQPIGSSALWWGFWTLLLLTSMLTIAVSFFILPTMSIATHHQSTVKFGAGYKLIVMSFILMALGLSVRMHLNLAARRYVRPTAPTVSIDSDDALEEEDLDAVMRTRRKPRRRLVRVRGTVVLMDLDTDPTKSWTCRKPAIYSTLQLTLGEAQNHIVASKISPKTDVASPYNQFVTGAGMMSAFALLEGCYLSVGLRGVSLMVPYTLSAMRWQFMVALWAVMAVVGSAYVFRIPSPSVHSPQQRINKYAILLSLALFLVEAMLVAPMCSVEYRFLNDVSKVGKHVLGTLESSALQAARKMGLRSATTTTTPAPRSGLLQSLMDRGLCHGLHESVWLVLMSVFSSVSLLLVLWGSMYSLFHTVGLKIAFVFSSAISRLLGKASRWRSFTESRNGQTALIVEKQPWLRGGLARCFSWLPVRFLPNPGIQRWTYLGNVDKQQLPHGDGVMQRRELGTTNGHQISGRWKHGSLLGVGTISCLATGSRCTIQTVHLIHLETQKVKVSLVMSQAESNMAHILHKTTSSQTQLEDYLHQMKNQPRILYLPNFWSLDSTVLRDAALLTSVAMCTTVVGRLGAPEREGPLRRLLAGLEAEGPVHVVCQEAAFGVAKSVLSLRNIASLSVLDVTQDIRHETDLGAGVVNVYPRHAQRCIWHEKQGDAESLLASDRFRIILSTRRSTPYHLPWTEPLTSWLPAEIAHDVGNLAGGLPRRLEPVTDDVWRLLV